MPKNITPHKRYNPLADEWVLVSPHRSKRPWQGQEENITLDNRPPFDPKCYLCPGVERIGGEKNPQYENTHVFTNDFSALLPESIDEQDENIHPLFHSKPESGVCRVICFSPRHDLSIARMKAEQARNIVNTWTDEYTTLGVKEHINHVQIFENKGESMGCSNPHPHGQVWATQTIPTLPAREQVQQQNYLAEQKTCLLCDYVNLELKKKERVVFSNDSFVALVPYWAVWPFETLLLPRIHISSLLSFSDKEKDDLADALVRMAARYDNLFSAPFPYSMGIHQQPTDDKEHPEWHFHIHYYPPLLRSATVKKFMVGFEMLAMPQRDLTAEDCAARLRDLSEIHYMEGL